MHSSQQTQDIIELTELVEVPVSDDTTTVPSQNDTQHDTAAQTDELFVADSNVHAESSTASLQSDISIVSDSIKNPHYMPSAYDVPTEDVTNDILVKLDDLDAIIKPAVSPPTKEDHTHPISSLEALKKQCDALQTELHACVADAQKISEHTYTFEAKLIKLQSRIDMLEHQLENYASFGKRINELEISLQDIQTNSVQSPPPANAPSSTDDSISTLKELIAILEQRCVLLENKLDTTTLIETIVPQLTAALQPTIEHGALLAASRIIKEELQALLEEK